MSGRVVDGLEVDEVEGGGHAVEGSVGLAERVDKADGLDQVFLDVFHVHAELCVSAQGGVDQEGAAARGRDRIGDQLGKVHEFRDLRRVTGVRHLNGCEGEVDADVEVDDVVVVVDDVGAATHQVGDRVVKRQVAVGGGQNDAAELDVVVHDVASDDGLVGDGQGVRRSLGDEDDMGSGVVVLDDLVDHLLQGAQDALLVRPRQLVPVRNRVRQPTSHLIRVHLHHRVLDLGRVAERHDGEVRVDRQVVPDELLGSLVDPLPHPVSVHGSRRLHHQHVLVHRLSDYFHFGIQLDGHLAEGVVRRPRFQAEIGKVGMRIDHFARGPSLTQDVVLCRRHRTGCPVTITRDVGQEGQVAEGARDVVQTSRPCVENAIFVQRRVTTSLSGHHILPDPV